MVLKCNIDGNVSVECPLDIVDSILTNFRKLGKIKILRDLINLIFISTKDLLSRTLRNLS